MQIRKLAKSLVWFGTYVGKTPQESLDALPSVLEQASQAGYRRFDSGTSGPAYKNVNKVIGNFLNNKNREEYEICVKFNQDDLWNNDHSLQQPLKQVLDDLQTSYIDVLMIHNPALLLHEGRHQLINELIQFKKAGKIKHIGVSNFNLQELKWLGEYLSDITYVQNEIHPYNQQSDVIEFCQVKGIEVMAARPFAKNKLTHSDKEFAHHNVDMLNDPTLQEIAKRHGIKVQELILHWLTERNIIAITRTMNPDHMQGNLAVCDTAMLTPDDMAAIAKLDKKIMTVDWTTFVDPKKRENRETVTAIPLKRRVGLTSSQEFNIFSRDSAAEPANKQGVSSTPRSKV